MVYKTADEARAAEPENPSHNLTLADFREMLKHHEHDMKYPEWFFGMCRRIALGAQDRSTEVGWFNAFNEWIARSPHYAGRKETEALWLYAEDRGNGAEDLIELSIDGGWVPTPDQAARIGLLSDGWVPTPEQAACIGLTPRDYFERAREHTEPQIDASSELRKFRPKVPNLKAARPRYLIKGVLQEATLAVIYGKWGTGKSTFALEMAASIARGVEWHGRRVRQGRVVYVASEAVSGFRMRLDAYLRANQLTIDDLYSQFREITGRPHLLKPDQVKDLLEELKELGPIALIVIDTYARSIPGADENATQYVQMAAENCQRIIDATGACVCLIHHTGKDESKGMRGSSSLPAAIDTEIELEAPKDGGKVRTARIGKQRDGADYFKLFDYELEPVVLGRDEDGDEIRSIVVHEVDSPNRVSREDLAAPSPGTNLRIVWETAQEMRALGLGKQTTELGMPEYAISIEQLIDRAVPRISYDPSKADLRRKLARTAIARLQPKFWTVRDNTVLITDNAATRRNVSAVSDFSLMPEAAEKVSESGKHG